mmetsp:Transcript_40527/g.93158  ORF Transcript_40527/g.93158 Transcript_40527/m.93158 type:complete len:248 (+) Transcript_40527:1904-2647(+)
MLPDPSVSNCLKVSVKARFSRSSYAAMAFMNSSKVTVLYSVTELQTSSIHSGTGSCTPRRRRALSMSSWCTALSCWNFLNTVIAAGSSWPLPAASSSTVGTCNASAENVEPASCATCCCCCMDCMKSLADSATCPALILRFGVPSLCLKRLVRRLCCDVEACNLEEEALGARLPAAESPSALVSGRKASGGGSKTRTWRDGGRCFPGGSDLGRFTTNGLLGWFDFACLSSPFGLFCVLCETCAGCSR